MRLPLTVWVTWLVLMAGANLATPLYALYAARFHFSSLVLTTVFATYAAVLVPALILFGRLSDRFGRRPVILAGLAVAAIGLGLFAAASGTAWLYAARIVQGLAVGMVGGPATAALVELDPNGDRRRAALSAGLDRRAGARPDRSPPECLRNGRPTRCGSAISSGSARPRSWLPPR
jgi:MFS family permease